MNNEEVKVRWDLKEVEGWRGAICQCGCTKYIPAPKEDGWYTIVCPLCHSSSQLFCRKRKENEKEIDE